MIYIFYIFNEIFQNLINKNCFDKLLKLFAEKSLKYLNIFIFIKFVYRIAH